MTNELQEIKDLFEQIDQRIKALEDKYKTEEEFEPKYGVKYWVVAGNGVINDYTWTDDFFDDTAFGNDAIFRTKEEAEFEAGRLKVLRELGKLGRPFKAGDLNWRVMLSGKGEIVFSCSDGERYVYGNYYFDTGDKANEAVNNIGRERIKKYLFGMED